MTLLRAGARTMLASYFLSSGVSAVRRPAQLAPAAEPVARRLVPAIKKYAPAQVARYIPEDPSALVRVTGAVQIVGSVALATGRGRRLGALLLARTLGPGTFAKHPFWTRTDPAEKELDRAHFVKDLSLLGGLLLAAQDTEGKPSLAWWAQQGGRAIAKTTSKTSGQLAKRASKLTDQGNDLADRAKAGGAALAGAALASSRRARKAAAKQAEQARDAAAKAAKQAKKDAPKQQRAAKKAAAVAAKNAPKAAKAAQKAAALAAKQAKKNAPRQAKAARQQEREAARQQQEQIKLQRQEALRQEKELALAAKAARRSKNSGTVADKVSAQTEAVAS